MGFPLSDVLTESDLVEEFQCKICHNLVEYNQCSYTSCSHIFCESCLSDWLARGAVFSMNTTIFFQSKTHSGAVVVSIVRSLDSIRTSCERFSQGSTEYITRDAYAGWWLGG